MTHEYHFNLQGVSCGGCIKAIETRLETSGQVASAQFDLPTRTVVINSAASADEIIQLIRDAGYDASIQSGLADRSEGKTDLS